MLSDLRKKILFSTFFTKFRILNFCFLTDEKMMKRTQKQTNEEDEQTELNELSDYKFVLFATAVSIETHSGLHQCNVCFSARSIKI